MNRQQSSVSDLPKGPFTATKLWNEVVAQMKASLTVKRRRWRMKTYEDAFIASEALDWLHNYLKHNPNFGQNVSRQQAVQLCQKFLTNGIIEDVRGKGYNTTFEDNNHLYRFKTMRYSPYKTVASPDKILNKENPSYSNLKSSESTSSMSSLKTSPKRLKRRPSFSFKPSTLSAAPIRTPLVDKLNLPEAARSDSKAVKAPVKRRKLIRRDSSSSIIMNPVALGFQENRRSLTEKEINDVWWNITITRLASLLDMRDISPEDYKIEDYDTSCVRENAEEQKICKGPLEESTANSSFPKYPGFERDVFKAVVEYYESLSAPMIEANILPLFIKTAESIVKCKLTALKSLQYCCLLLQPRMRRNLQVLLKFMVKLSQNNNIALSQDLPTRELVIQAFSRCTFGRACDINAIRLLFFMMENFPDNFKRPEGLQFQVEQRILFLHNCRGNKHHNPNQNRDHTYCERVTKEEFKQEGILNSQKALRDLLNQIIESEGMSEKERKKQLKQFEKAYPSIYHSRFPAVTAGGTGSLQRSDRLRKAIKPLSRKGLR